MASSAATLSAISFEYASVRHPSHCPLGIYVQPSSSSLLVWDGVFFVHKGYYSGAILKFRLSFPSNYPEKAPQVHFVTDVFHPLVSQRDGLFSLTPRIPTWRPREHHVFDVLFWLKSAFKQHALDQLKEKDCLNKEAYRYRESTASFSALANQSSLLSQSDHALYDQDYPSLTGKRQQGFLFQEAKPEVLQSLREQLGLKEWAVQEAPPEESP
ncbi:UBC-like protein [Serendipita vermifera]|nr:UBC-like protein [Serendipita vermifera]